MDPSANVSADGIEFLRCKGGAIQAMSQSLEALQTFRSLWQLTVKQLFPSLSFADAIASGTDLPSTLATAYEELDKAQSLPSSNWPYGYSDHAALSANKGEQVFRRVVQHLRSKMKAGRVSILT